MRLIIVKNSRNLNKRGRKNNEHNRNIDYNRKYIHTNTTTCHVNRKSAKKKLQDIKHMHASECVCMDILVIFMEYKKSWILDKM